MATKYEQYELLIKINKIQGRITNDGKTRVSKSNKDKDWYLNERAKLIAQTQLTLKLMRIRNEIRCVGKAFIFERGKDNLFSGIDEKLTVLKKDIAKSVSNYFYWLNCRKMLFTNLGDFIQCKRVIIQIIKLLEEHPFIIATNSIIYPMMLISLCNACLRLNQFNEYEKYSQLANTYKPKTLKEDLYFFENFSDQYITYMMRANFPKNEVLKKMFNYQDQYKKYYHEMNVESLFLFPSLKCRVYIFYEEYEDALNALNETRSEINNKKGWRKDIYATLDLYHLAIQYGQKNYVVLKNVASNAKRLLKKENNYFELEKVLIKFLKILNSLKTI